MMSEGAISKPRLLSDHSAVSPSSVSINDQGYQVLEERLGIEEGAMEVTPTELSVRNISISVGEKQILKNLYGDIKPGKMTCILGASGAGKTTFLNFLSGRIEDGGTYSISGDFYANGHKVVPKKFRKHIAYVTQQDHILSTSTVREAIRFSARLRRDLPENEVERLVNVVLDSLRIRDCADRLVGNDLIRGISGGEKKRTSIALELVSNPTILFLDEPTSGLDSYSAWNAMRIVKQLNETGCSVVATLHQPSSEIFHLFDEVIILHAGQFVYNGAVSDLRKYLASVNKPCPPEFNIADHALFIVQTQSDDDMNTLIRTWQDRNPPKAIEEGAMLKDSDIISHSFFYQLMLLGQREFHDLTRDYMGFAAGIFMTAFLGTLFGNVFHNIGRKNDTPDDIFSHAGALTNIAISAMFGNAQPVLLTFQFRKPVFNREYSSGLYGVVPYFLSKFLLEVPKTAIICMIQILVSYWLMDLTGNFFEIYACIFGIAMVASSLALVMGCLAPNVEAAMGLSPVVFVPQILFCGFFIGISQIPSYLRWASYLCGLKYGLSLLVLVEFIDVDSPFVDYIWNRFDVKESDWKRDLYVLIALVVGFRILSAFALMFNSRRV